MESFAVLMFLVPFLNIRGIISTEDGKVFIVVLDKAYTLSPKSPLRYEFIFFRDLFLTGYGCSATLFVQLIEWTLMCRIEENVIRNNEWMVKDHDNFLKSLLAGTEHTKLYSYTHLLNGFAVHVTSDEVCYVML